MMVFSPSQGELIFRAPGARAYSAAPQALLLIPPSALCAEKKDFPFEKSFFPYFLLCRSNYSASCMAFAAATAFACASAEHCS